VLSVARFEFYVISTDTRVAELCVDWTLNTRFANIFEDMQYKKCYEAFNYNIYTVVLIKFLKL